METVVIMRKEFFSGKKVLVTGHTGFKGSWLCRILHLLGSEVYGYSLDPPTDPSLYELMGGKTFVNDIRGDIRDFNLLQTCYNDISPDIVIHMAAQPIVRIGYKEPRQTYEINIMGTVNILECLRKGREKTCSFLNVTTDKVYFNDDSGRLYSENDRLDGFDPYSNSKSCSELVTGSYKNSFFKNSPYSISTARAGNVIGGGDFAPERIIPDCVRAAISKKTIILRNPNSIRPYQHVLEPLFSYLTIVESQYGNSEMSGSFNIGPDKKDCTTTGELATIFCKKWGEGLHWISEDDNGPREANYLKLDNSLIKERFGLTPLWNIENAIEKTVEWSKTWNNCEDILDCMDTQIRSYFQKRGIQI